MKMNQLRQIICFFALLILVSGCAKEPYITMEDVNLELPDEEITQTQIQKSTEESKPKEEWIYVDICGAVQNPGVYKVKEKTRLFQLIKEAGGFLEEADSNYENKAREVMDGEQIYILTKEEAAKQEAIQRDNPMLTTQGKAEEEAGKVNLNTASESALCTIPGVGKSRAQSIISYREERGAFESIEDIKKVTGIKDGIYEKMKEYITVK